MKRIFLMMAAVVLMSTAAVAQDGQRPQVGHAGLVQVKIRLECFNRFPGAFPITAGEIPGIILQFFQPRL